jgi:hypothetical protein
MNVGVGWLTVQAVPSFMTESLRPFVLCLLLLFFIIWIHNKPTCFWILRLTINNNIAIIYCLPTPCSRVLLGKLTISGLFKKWLAFYASWNFITASTRARQIFLSRTRLIQSIPGLGNLFWYSLPTCAFLEGLIIKVNEGKTLIWNILLSKL